MYVCVCVVCARAKNLICFCRASVYVCWNEQLSMVSEDMDPAMHDALLEALCKDEEGDQFIPEELNTSTKASSGGRAGCLPGPSLWTSHSVALCWRMCTTADG